MHFVHSSVDGHLGCVHLLSSMNNAAVNTRGQVLYVFSSLGCLPRSGLLHTDGAGEGRNGIRTQDSVSQSHTDSYVLPRPPQPI